MFDTLSSSLDTVLYVWAGCSGPELVCNDDFGLGADMSSSSYVGLPLTAGQQVVIVVDSYSTAGAFTLRIRGPAAPGNCCAQRGEPGCEDAEHESCVCEVDGFCCGTAWDKDCVAGLISFCAVDCP